MKRLLIVCLLVIGAIITKAQKDSLQKIDANLLMVIVDSKVGYIDTLGNKVISPAFVLGNQFSEGVASVTHQSKKGFRYAFIDPKMDVAVPTLFDAAGSFSEGLARVQVNGKWGYINKKGSTVIEPQYSLCYDFIDGYAKVSKKGKWGIINKLGKWIIKPQYASITQVRNGVFAAQKAYGTAWKFMNLEEALVIKDSFDKASYFNIGLAPVRNSDDKWGFINTKGEVVIPYQFSGAFEFSDNGLACVKQNGYWGYINTKGEVVIEFKYTRGGKFRYNYALVEGLSNYGYINNKGEFIWQRLN